MKMSMYCQVEATHSGVVTTPKRLECHALAWLYIPRGLSSSEGGSALALPPRSERPVGVEPVEEGFFYHGPRDREQPMVAILHLHMSS